MNDWKVFVGWIKVLPEDRWLTNVLYDSVWDTLVRVYPRIEVDPRTGLHTYDPVAWVLHCIGKADSDIKKMSKLDAINILGDFFHINPEYINDIVAMNSGENIQQIKDDIYSFFEHWDNERLNRERLDKKIDDASDCSFPSSDPPPYDYDR